MLAKTLAALLIAMSCLISFQTVFATPQEISATGEYRLGDRDSRETAKMAALADAKRKIIEQAGVYIESYSEVNQFKLTKDQIKSTANALIKIKNEHVDFYENGVLCKAFVTAVIDTADIEELVKIFIKPKPTRDKNFLKIAGIEEYNGHYYKVFNDGLNWTQAKQRCEEIGGHLVTITSNTEQAIITELIVSQGTKGYYWTGGVRNTAGDFIWITGEKFSYSNWGNGEPNGLDASGKVNENIVTIYKHPRLDGIWNDVFELGNNGGQWHYYDIENSGFVCEWDSYDAINV